MGINKACCVLCFYDLNNMVWGLQADILTKSTLFEL